MELADILAEDSVLTCTGITDKRQLFEVLAQKAAERTGLTVSEIVDALVAREELGSTGLGNGIAIPHGKLKGLDGVVAVFARLDDPIEFDSVDDQPVDLVMLLLAPVGAGADHLKALSRVARMLRTESVVDQLRGDDDTARMRAVLTAPLETNCAA
ncbi:PTS sugar transporter subunit IIA [Devosia elaeis]|jgi:Phosphotransferase system mannitol/fructose-specific IIA domain (Ntr-type)|uniref:Transcriptional regulator n=1 Tax=Devosia elaeis TaxID=1770058 RepID=A0A178HWG4_9HYPH|nr:PTS sugar transporter subunit IIA [Devosia elaeis]OAM76325.1 transcriptional regulator [Devosia elaeis]